MKQESSRYSKLVRCTQCMFFYDDKSRTYDASATLSKRCVHRVIVLCTYIYTRDRCTHFPSVMITILIAITVIIIIQIKPLGNKPIFVQESKNAAGERVRDTKNPVQCI